MSSSTSFRSNILWRAVLLAWLTSGAVFLAANIALTWGLFGMTPGLTVRYIASLVMGDAVLTGAQPATVFVVGVGVHALLSLAFTLLIVVVVHRWGLLVGLAGGAILGLSIYALNLYALTVWFPWFFAINSPAMLVSHVLFGLVAGGVYELFDRYDQPLIAQEASRV